MYVGKVVRLNVLSLAFALSGIGMSATAFADTVVLQDGQRFEGVVDETETSVSIEIDMGTITFAKEEVRAIERSPTAVHAFEERLWAIDHNDVEALQDLAQWASQQGLPTRAYTLHRAVVTLNPNNPRSRRALGHVLRDGEWVDPDAEAHAALAKAVSRKASELNRIQEAQAILQSVYRASEQARVPPPPPVAEGDGFLSSSVWNWQWYPGLGQWRRVRRGPQPRIGRGQRPRAGRGQQPGYSPQARRRARPGRRGRSASPRRAARPTNPAARPRFVPAGGRAQPTASASGAGLRGGAGVRR